MPLAHNRFGPNRWTFWIAAALLFSAVAVLWFVVPLGREFGRAILGSSTPPGGANDPILNAGILEWGRKALLSDSLHVFEWTAGFPQTNSLASTENLLGWQLLYAPLRAAGLGVIPSYNVLLLYSFVISGLGMALLARQFGACNVGALVAGSGFAFMPLHLVHMIHIQTLAICWVPFVFFYLERFLTSGSSKDVIGLTSFFVLTSLSGINVALYLALLLGIFLILRLVTLRRRPAPRDIALLACGMVAGLAIGAPVALHYVRFHGAQSLSHPVEELVRYSNSLAAFVGAPAWQSIWSNTSVSRHAVGIPSLPSLVLVLLALVYLWRIRRDMERRRIAAVFLTLILVAAALSLGPSLKILGDYPSTRASWIPLPGRLLVAVSALRHPHRLLLFAYAFLALLAGLGTTVLTEKLPKQRRRLFALLVLSLLLLEFRPRASFAGDSVRVAEPLLISDAYPFLAKESDRGAVVEWPWAHQNGSRDGSAISRYVYGSAGHLRRIVVYRKTVALPAADSFQTAADALPDDGRRSTLWAAGVTRLVIHRRGPRGAEGERRIIALRNASYIVLHDGAESTVFSLAPPFR